MTNIPKVNFRLSKKTLSFIGIGSGSIIVILTLLMGYLGIPSAGFGPRKIALGVFGLVVLISGIVLFFWKRITVKRIIDSANYSWKTLFLFTFLITYVYVIFDWIFNVTKQSFLNYVPWLPKIGILFSAAAMIAFVAGVTITVFYGINLIPGFNKNRKIILFLASIVPIGITSSLIMILVDNFTYTVIGVGIVNTANLVRLLYLTGFVFLFLFLLVRIQGILSDISTIFDMWKNRNFIVPSIIAIVIISLVLSYRNNNEINAVASSKKLVTESYPNIILITADGLSATHTSLYGYSLDTTPRIKELAPDSLVVENAFSNSTKTFSALLAFLTSKDPFDTRVLYPPDILRNQNSYQHLPGILKSLGYYTAQITHPYFADAYDANLQSGFDFANGRSVNEGNIFDFISKNFIPNVSYFVYQISNRLSDRLAHIFFIRQMVNQEALVNGTEQKYDDTAKITNAINILTQKPQPVFMQIHWMGTHGGVFELNEQVFSAGMSMDQQGNWNDAFYADSILEFDKGVGEIVDFLKSKGLWENTILIVSGDHGEEWSTTDKIPLLIHFPGGQYSGIRKNNVQQLDVAPTVLDYLGIDKPSWMEGSSFLSTELTNRPIFSAGVDLVGNETAAVRTKPLEPPFYQFGSIIAVYCNSWFSLELNTHIIDSGLVEGYTRPCEKNVSNEQFMAWIIQHLDENGFDTSSLNALVNSNP